MMYPATVAGVSIVPDPTSERKLTDGTGNGDPFETVIELEGKHKNVDPGDLGNGNAVCNWERGIKDSFGASDDLIQG